MHGAIGNIRASEESAWPTAISDIDAPDPKPDTLAFEGLAPKRLESAKQSYATRRVDLSLARHLLTNGIRPRAGDLLLARIAQIGHHRRIESPEGRRRQLYVGDEVLLCYAARYASEQFEALVPDTLGPCHMVAAGGIAARCISRHDNTKPATKIQPIGVVADADRGPLNLIDFAMPVCEPPAVFPYTIAVLGTSMNAGKTTSAAALIHGLTVNGFRVGAGKVTGTGAGGDRWALIDAGASEVYDFTDFGYASTYTLSLEKTEDVLRRTSHTLACASCDVIVLEVADGLFFSESAGLVAGATFRQLVDGVMLAAPDAMSADAGARWLRRHALSPVAITGRITSSPLAIREARSALAEPVVSLDDLARGVWTPPQLKLPVRISA